jgi:hypothetical protein
MVLESGYSGVTLIDNFGVSKTWQAPGLYFVSSQPCFPKIGVCPELNVLTKWGLEIPKHLVTFVYKKRSVSLHDFRALAYFPICS